MDKPTLDGWLEDLAAGTPAPGGGSAATLAGALAAALVVMVARLTSGRQAHAPVQGRIDILITEANAIRTYLRRLVDDDAVAYARVGTAPQATKDDALLGAIETPLATARGAARLITLAREVAAIGNPSAQTDAKVGELLARAALAAAVENIRVNVAALSRPELGRPMLDEAEKLERAVKT